MRPTQSPYRRLNLTRNPFGELTARDRAELAIVEVSRWLPQLRKTNSALQFIGPCGHGKTTHLLSLSRALPGSQYIYLPENGPHPGIPRVRPLLLDEAQRLTWWGRRRLFFSHGNSEPGPLVLGTHEDLSAQLKRGGFRVSTYFVESEHSPLRLQNILNRRIESARRSDGSLPTIELSLAAEMCERFGADIRAIENYLYQRFQQMVWEMQAWPPVI